MPALTTMISEDMLRLELQKASDEVIEEFGQERTPKPVPESVSKLLPSKRKCHSHSTVLRYVQILPELVDQMAIQDPWIHLLIHRIIYTTAFDPLISNEEIATSLIVSLLLSSIEKFPSTKLHLFVCVFS
uniref:Uncharacterized protein n=1 Tax=Ditylenchus dipsaci TaxID=166011 RepID=A0A915DH32_9BILA